MDGMEAVYPGTSSALARGRRLRRRDNDRVHQRQRHRTMPVTFAEIKEVDEDSCVDVGCSVGEERRRRPDVLDERLGSGSQLAEYRRRRARTEALRELSPPAHAHAPAPGSGPSRASSEPDALHRHDADGAGTGAVIALPPAATAPHT